jgi:hypothetical protein
MDLETKKAFDELRTFIGEQTKIKSAVEQIEEQLKGIPATIENKLAAVRRTQWDPRTGNYRGVFDTEDDARCFGLFIMAHVGNDVRAMEALKGEMKSVFERAMGDTTAEGSGIVPIEYARRIERLVEAFGVWAANAFPMPMASDSLTFQRRTQGLTVFKTGRNVAATASELGFQTINLNAEEWNVLCLVPKSLDEDAAGAIGELVMIEIALAFANQLDICGFTGDGTPEKLDVWGIIPRLITINGVDDGGGLVLASGNLWSEIVEADINKLIGQCPAYQGIMPKMYCSNPFFWQVLNPINNAKGGVSKAEFQGVQKLQCMGYPVEIVNVMAKTQANSQVPLLFGDLRLSSTHGRRKDVMVESSTDVKFLERQIAVLGTQRHAVANHSLGDATSAGPVVGLVTQAS